MAGTTTRFGHRVSIGTWRVKVGKKDVYVSERRGDAEDFLRKFKGPGKPRLVPPNRAHK